MQWLKSQRIAHAKLLLEKTFLTVKEVRALVGAPDASHFARQFRHAFGLSPIQFRAYRTAQIHPRKIQAPSIARKAAE